MHHHVFLLICGNKRREQKTVNRLRFAPGGEKNPAPFARPDEGSLMALPVVSGVRHKIAGNQKDCPQGDHCGPSSVHFGLQVVRLRLLLAQTAPRQGLLPCLNYKHRQRGWQARISP
jgi:hypothetical protein